MLLARRPQLRSECAAGSAAEETIEARRLAGFRSIDLIRRDREHDVEFMTLMWFDTLESVKAFTGEDHEVAHVPAEARAVLADFDERSAHYEVLDRRAQPG